MSIEIIKANEFKKYYSGLGLVAHAIQNSILQVDYNLLEGMNDN